jgi:hypothetical protein
MHDLRTPLLGEDEADGLDETSTGVPSPHAASEFSSDYALPTVVPKRVHPVAVVSLLCAVVLPFVGIPLAHWVIRKLQHNGGRGAAIAHTAIVVGYLSLLLLALVVVNVVVALVLASR